MRCDLYVIVLLQRSTTCVCVEVQHVLGQGACVYGIHPRIGVMYFCSPLGPLHSKRWLEAFDGHHLQQGLHGWGKWHETVICCLLECAL